MKSIRTTSASKVLTLWDSMVTLITVVVCIATSVVHKTSMFFGFATANVILIVYFSKKGWSVRSLLYSAWQAVYNCRIVYIVIFLMGASIVSWIASGVIPAIIFYGFAVFTKPLFLLMAFWLCMLVALIMGTALGTISTIGIALLGIGRGLGIPLEMVLGAIVSGAYVSDKMSPISGLVNMNLGLTGIAFKDFFKESLKTFIPVAIICSLFYAFLGLSLNESSAAQMASGNQDMVAIKTQLEALFHLSPLLFLIPAFLIGMTMKGVKIYYSMTVCIVLGVVSAIGYQGAQPIQVADWLWNGYRLGEESGVAAQILKGGGIKPMLEVLFIVACAVGFSGIIEKTGALMPFIDSIVKPTDGIAKTTAKTGLLSILFLSIACDQSLAIILPVKSMRSVYERLSLGPVYMSRVVFDTGVMLAPIQFWNVNTIIITAMTGLGASAYGPWALLIWIYPIVALLYGVYHQLRVRKALNEKGELS